MGYYIKSGNGRVTMQKFRDKSKGSRTYHTIRIRKEHSSGRGAFRGPESRYTYPSSVHVHKKQPHSAVGPDITIHCSDFRPSLQLDTRISCHAPFPLHEPLHLAEWTTFFPRRYAKCKNVSDTTLGCVIDYGLLTGIPDRRGEGSRETAGVRL